MTNKKSIKYLGGGGGGDLGNVFISELTLPLMEQERHRVNLGSPNHRHINSQ